MSATSSGASPPSDELVAVPIVAHHTAMRIPIALSLLVLSAPAAAQSPSGSVFLSPMGEPFRSTDAASDNAGRWFAAADRDGDGTLSSAELRADALRFFAALDVDGDGEIEPVEMARYENELAPEVQVGLQMRGAGFGDWRGRGSRRRRLPLYDEGIEGGGRYAFLNIPQPVIAADSDMNRGVSRDEFERAADQRFALLDKDRDGRLARAELPPLPQPRLRKKRNDEEDPPVWRRRAAPARA
jgi:Ca2+-binding EF-hand superfamily protein